MSEDPTTHLLDMETARFARRWPERTGLVPLCGADEMGPVDLAPYGGAITCAACRGWSDARNAPVSARP